MTADSITRMTPNFNKGADIQNLFYFIYSKDGEAQIQMTLTMRDGKVDEFKKGTREEGMAWLNAVINQTTNPGDIQYLQGKRDEINAARLSVVVSRPVEQTPRTVINTLDLSTHTL